MSGEMSIAPMITAVELTLSPSEAMKMAKTSTHKLEPWKDTPLLICSMVSASCSLSGSALKYRLMVCHKIWEVCAIVLSWCEDVRSEKVENPLLYCHKSRLERQTKGYVWGKCGMLAHRVFEVFETRKDGQTHSEEQTFRSLVAIAHSQTAEITKARITRVCFR